MGFGLLVLRPRKRVAQTHSIPEPQLCLLIPPTAVERQAGFDYAFWSVWRLRKLRGYSPLHGPPCSPPHLRAKRLLIQALELVDSKLEEGVVPQSPRVQKELPLRSCPCDGDKAVGYRFHYAKRVVSECLHYVHVKPRFVLYR